MFAYFRLPFTWGELLEIGMAARREYEDRARRGQLPSYAAASEADCDVDLGPRQIREAQPTPAGARVVTPRADAVAQTLLAAMLVGPLAWRIWSRIRRVRG